MIILESTCVECLVAVALAPSNLRPFRTPSVNVSFVAQPFSSLGVSI